VGVFVLLGSISLTVGCFFGKLAFLIVSFILGGVILGHGILTFVCGSISHISFQELIFDFERFVSMFDFERFVSMFDWTGCVHTLLLIACSCFCNIHGEYPVISFTSITFPVVSGFQLGGGNNFNSSISGLKFSKGIVRPFFIASIVFLDSGESLLR